MTINLRDKTPALLVCAGLWSVACGGSASNSGPVSPTAPTGSVTSLAVSGTPPPVGGTSQFTAVATSSSGTTQNVTNSAAWESSNSTVVVVSNSGVVTGVGIGEADVRATLQGVSGSQHISLVGPALTTFQRDYIEAIFLGSGPLTPTDGSYNCPTFPGTWSGFPRGTTIRIKVSTTVSSDKRMAIERTAAQVIEATAGAILTALELIGDPNPNPGVNEVTSTTHPSPGSEGCQSDNGCTIHSFASRGVFRSSRAVQPANQTPNAYAHDAVGHGIMGMCHVDARLIGGGRPVADGWRA